MAAMSSPCTPSWLRLSGKPWWRRSRSIASARSAWPSSDAACSPLAPRASRLNRNTGPNTSPMAMPWSTPQRPPSCNASAVARSGQLLAAPRAASTEASTAAGSASGSSPMLVNAT